MVFRPSFQRFAKLFPVSKFQVSKKMLLLEVPRLKQSHVSLCTIDLDQFDSLTLLRADICAYAYIHGEKIHVLHMTLTI